MQKTPVVHHKTTDAQPVPKQGQPPSTCIPPVLLLSPMSYGVGYPFGELESDVPTVSPSSTLCTPQCSLVGQPEEQRSPWFRFPAVEGLICPPHALSPPHPAPSPWPCGGQWMDPTLASSVSIFGPAGTGSARHQGSF